MKWVEILKTQSSERFGSKKSLENINEMEGKKISLEKCIRLALSWGSTVSLKD